MSNVRCGFVSILFVSLFTVGLFAAEMEDAKALYKATGIQGGLVVHLGCQTGDYTATLRVNDRYVVQGIDTDAKAVSAGRKVLRGKGLYGPVTLREFNGKKLPYVRNTVTLLVAKELGDVEMAEVMRVLAPKGVAWIDSKKHVKPRPDDIDEWTHFLHDSGGNAVANDQQIHPPRAVRWIAGPKYARSHELPSSVQGVVTSGGRIFTIFDEGPTGVFEGLPWKCKLIARDAFNGKLLWKIPLEKWDGKLGAGSGNRWNIHHTLPRRLVAKGDRVFATLRFLDSPVSVIDAATGKVIIEALPHTKGADEMVLCGDVLVVKTSKGRSTGATQRLSASKLDNTLVAIDIETGQRLWKSEGIHVAPYSLAVNEGRVVYHNTNEIVCLDLKNGIGKWKIPGKIKVHAGKICMVVTKGTVLFQAGRLTVHSLEDGKLLWQKKSVVPIAAAATQPTDVFVANDIVWLGTSTEGYDLKTGSVKQKVNLHKVISPGHHRRCLRGKATVNYVIRNKRGAEFIDLSGKDNHMRNDWLRTPCFTGGTPANGIFYKPPDQCFCYPGVLISGYAALCSDPVSELKPSGGDGLVKGPAFGDVKEIEITEKDWPMYRRDNIRSGRTSIGIGDKLQQKWQFELDAKGSQPVVVGQRLYLSEKETCTVRCLNIESGKPEWAFVAGGPVDSSPTVCGGMVIFGCRDGYVYALRGTDGHLVWRFRAAPDGRQILSYERIESLWPVSGSVLVQDGQVYFAAGRSSFLDGGILVYALDFKTGKVVNSHVLNGPISKRTRAGHLQWRVHLKT